MTRLSPSPPDKPDQPTPAAAATPNGASLSRPPPTYSQARDGRGSSNPALSKETLAASDNDDDKKEKASIAGSDDSEKGESGSGSGSDSSDRSVEVIPITRPALAITRTVSVPEVRDGIENRRDPELGGESPIDEKAGGILGGKEQEQQERDPNLVTWDGPDDPDNPKNWPRNKKWAAMMVVSFFTLMSPMASSMIAPALTAIGRDLAIASGVEQALSLSIFVLAYAIGPLFMGPLSELYGRVIVLQLSNLAFLFFNLGCGLARTRGEMIAFRFLSGFGGAAPLAIGGGVLSDLFTAEERGRAMSVYSLTPLLGPAIGPIAGAYITQRTSWRWIFHATTLADALVQLVGLFFLRETYTPVLLARRRARLARETGSPDLRTPFDAPERSPARALRLALVRPFRLLATQPIVQVLSLYMLYLYGLNYIALSTFPALWESAYGEAVGPAGLNYIALGVGFFLGAQVCAPLQDRVYAALKRRHRVAVGRPEFRVPMMVPGALMVPAGLLVYGWCAEYRTHWIGPDVGIAVFAAGVIVSFQCIQGYLVDTYARYAASAVGAGTVMRSLAGFGFPLFAPAMFDRLGYGRGNTLLAGLAVAVGWPAPILLWRYGELLRKRSPFAAGGL